VEHKQLSNQYGLIKIMPKYRHRTYASEIERGNRLDYKAVVSQAIADYHVHEYTKHLLTLRTGDGSDGSHGLHQETLNFAVGWG
jgi:hypothetical protein